MTTTNPYCEVLGIAVPSVAAIRTHREANTFNLLIVTLLEHGHPMTLEAVAEHLAATGAAPNPAAARASLARCRPAREPVYRDGDLYGLDLHNDELDLWIFRLGLRPPRFEPPPPPPEPAQHPPRPPADQRLTVAELDKAWDDRSLSGWSAQRIALAVLDAHDTPLPGHDVVAFVNARTPYHILRTASPPPFRRGGTAIHIAPDGTWSIVPGAPELIAARNAVRDMVERVRTQPKRTSAKEWAAATAAHERRVDAITDEDASFRRVIVCSYPIDTPVAAVLLDVNDRAITHLTGADLASAPTRLACHDVIAGLDIRATLRGLGIDPGTRRLAELGPPQKTLTVEGQTFKLTPALFLEGSCGIRFPLGDDAMLRRFASRDQLDAVTARLEDHAKALFSLHQYAQLHGYVRLLTRRLDEIFGMPWLTHEVRRFRALQEEAARHSIGLIAVLSEAPWFDDPDPWARAVRLEVEAHGYQYVMFDHLGRPVDERDVQLARLEVAIN